MEAAVAGVAVAEATSLETVAAVESIPVEPAAEVPLVSVAFVADVEEIDEDVAQAVADAERHRAATAAAGVGAAAAAASPAESRVSEPPPAPSVRGVGKATGRLGRFLPGRRPPEPVAVEAELAAVEPELAAVEPEVAAVEAELVAVEPEVAAVEAEPVAVEPELAAVEPRDQIEIPTWRIVAPVDAEASMPRPDLPSAPLPQPSRTDLRPPQWPMPAATAAPQWSSRPAATPPAVPAVDLWAVSSQDVLNRPGSGVQACVSCGLPLSATARFCRRCGSQQH
jgi:hypothetical protein